MRVDEESRTVELTERNLRALLVKLTEDAPKGSACTLSKPSVQGRHWLVIAVPDETHYSDREPGELHPETEVRLYGS